MLQVSRLSKSFGIHTVLGSMSFQLAAGERVGLVGVNGSGKSTLLRVIIGEEPATSGSITIAPGVELGYLPQALPDVASGTTIDAFIEQSLGGLRSIEQRLRKLETLMTDPDADFDDVLAEYGKLQERFELRGGYELEHRIDQVLDGLGLGTISREQPVETLSGGEAERVMLAALLLRSPDLLLLDEPTNHLDFAAATWLGDYLADFKGSLLVVSHDRHFLNATVTRILAIDEHSHEISSFTGNYDAYRVELERRRVAWETAYQAQQAEINELQRAIKVAQRSGNRPPPPRRDPDKSIYNAQAEKAQLTAGATIRDLKERLRRIEADPIPKPPERLTLKADLGDVALRSADAIRLEGVSVELGGRQVLKSVDFHLGAGERALIVGPNGAGKSTIVNLITGHLEPGAGDVTVAPGAELGVLDQLAAELPSGETVYDVYRFGLVDYEHHLISDLLRHGLFTLDDLGKSIDDLSLGERRKLQLARLAAQPVNLLIIDEPTNYLSLEVLEEFERALAAFPGPVLAISHDRWFIERFAGDIWELNAGTLTRRYGSADDVLQQILINDDRQSEYPVG